MAPQVQEPRLAYADASALSSSSERTAGQDSEPPTAQAPASTSKRSSSVRFAHDTEERDSHMSDRRVPAGDYEEDEIAPIRNADGHANRSYQTTEPRVEHVGQTTVKGPSERPPPVNDQEEEDEHQSWWKRMLVRYGSVTLENKGSVARDHLALERTFLAWLRTSLAFASIGIAVTQLFRLNTTLNDDKDSAQSATTSTSQQLPLSPLLGHGLAPELIPFLQQLAASALQTLPTPAPANTLLDQLLLLQSRRSSLSPSLQVTAFDEHAAQKLRRAGKPLGATFIAISIIVLLVGFHRYFEAQFWIIRGKFPASRGSIALVGLIAAALIIASLIVVLVVAPVSYQTKT